MRTKAVGRAAIFGQFPPSPETCHFLPEPAPSSEKACNAIPEQRLLLSNFNNTFVEGDADLAVTCLAHLSSINSQPFR